MLDASFIRLLILALAVLLISDRAKSQEKPNVLLIVADDLGYSDLGCYGGDIETPNLDQLAANGIRLTRFYSTGRCCPSRASILTGQYPHRVGVGHKVADLERPGYRGRVSDEAITIAQALAPADYRSFISGKWHLGTADPTEHGFEEFYGTLVSAQTFWEPDHYLRLPAGREKRAYDEGEFYGTNAVTDHALDFLELARSTPDRPWFLYLAYHAPHFPLQAPRELIDKYADKFLVGWDMLRVKRLERMKNLGIVPDDTVLTPRSQFWNYGETRTGLNPPWDSLTEDRQQDLSRRMAIYAAMIDSIDQNVGRILSDLKQRGEFENTLIVFTSDNGACAEWDPNGFDIKSSNQNILHRGKQLGNMGQPGTYHSAGSGWANVSNTPWRLYKHYNHEGGIASPCVVHWTDGNLRQGEIDDSPSHLIDLMPTILASAETDYPGQIPMAGENILARLQDGRKKPRTLFFEHEGNRAIHDGDWKLVALRDEPWELYDMTHDRTELNDLAGTHPDVVSALSNRWEKWARENFVTPLPEDYEVDYLRQPGTQPPRRQ